MAVLAHTTWKDRDPEEISRRFDELGTAFGTPLTSPNSGLFMTYETDDGVRGYAAAPVVSFLAEGLKGDALIRAVRELATPSIRSGFEAKTTEPLISTSTRTVFFSDSSIKSIERDW